MDGKSLTGEILTTGANDQGIQLKTGEGQYEKVPWTNFSQGDLKKFQSNPKLAPLVEPYIEITSEERIKKTEVEIKPSPRVERPPPQSLFGALFSSALGWFLMLVLYAGIIYAGYEVALFRARPVPLVAGLSAIPFLGFFVPIIFLALPTNMPAAAAATEAPPEEPAADAAQAAAGDNPMQATGAERPAGLHLAASTPAEGKTEHTPATIFQRGQFTFNRRFFETKFASFFGVVRRDADKDMLLVIKSARGDYHGQRITRIASNDLHLEVKKGDASQEVMIPFQEIKEIQLKHKDAP
jgi:hypothetical protein